MQREAIATLPLRALTGRYYRQTRPSRQPLELLERAVRGARWHRVGDPWPAYAGDTPETAMLELPRYQVFEPGVKPVLPRRRLSELHVIDFPVVDLANPLALDQLELDRDDLRRGIIGEDPEAEICREIADEVRRRPDVLGLLVPSVPYPAGSVFVIFPAGFPLVTVGDQQMVKLAVVAVPQTPHAEDK
jgi:hypothetical protein